ncbi:uncharacterized protein LOC125499956 isoform X2 [Athalia rosae]|uniref:uncharacterized protein LOC125499956 isoform X2 n=1 Tax=Athalia rosae TaxID=37344 RepID=UPI0020334527|nr:uncharacterized protein LOC125499956 isoform X2 [Athalia rosae]
MCFGISFVPREMKYKAYQHIFSSQYIKPSYYPRVSWRLHRGHPLRLYDCLQKEIVFLLLRSCAAGERGSCVKGRGNIVGKESFCVSVTITTTSTSTTICGTLELRVLRT